MIITIADVLGRHVSAAQTAWMFDKTPPRILKTLSNQRFRATLQWAAQHSEFYKRAFHDRKIDASRVRTPADLGDFYTTPDDIVVHAQDFICKPPAIVFESSGT